MEISAQERFDQLTDVLEYANRQNREKFTAGEKIMMHQERAECLTVLNQLRTGEKVKPRERIVSTKIEVKIRQVVQWLNIKPLNN